MSTTVWGFNSGESIDDCEYPQVKDSNQCPEGDLNPLSHGAMNRPFAQQCRSKWVWAASCYPFAQVNAGRCSHSGNRLLIWVRWHRPPYGQRARQGRRPDLTSRHCKATTSSCVGQEADTHKQRHLPLSRRKDAPGDDRGEMDPRHERDACATVFTGGVVRLLSG